MREVLSGSEHFGLLLSIFFLRRYSSRRASVFPS